MWTNKYLDRVDAAQGLAKIRKEWEEAAGEQDLEKVKGSVGLLLEDTESAIGFIPGEIQELVSQEIVAE